MCCCCYCLAKHTYSVFVVMAVMIMLVLFAFKALTKKHEAVLADVEGFAGHVSSLNEQSKKCVGSSAAKQVPPPGSKQYAMAMYDYKPKTHREIPMKKGDVMVILNAVNKVGYYWNITLLLILSL